MIEWVDGAILAVKRGMTGATGNIYCGLHEFVEMAFLLHLLRPGDLFLDIGANIGSYTILASKVCGSRSFAFEPDPSSAKALRRNIALNTLENLVTVEEVALGALNGDIGFTVGLDTMNRVASSDDRDVQIVPVRRLDDVADASRPTLAKLDVEGFEEEVLAGGAKVLSSSDLLAVQSESSVPHVQDILGSFGFKQLFYEPYARILSPKPFGYRTSNAIFIRDASIVEQRVRTAPKRNILGCMI